MVKQRYMKSFILGCTLYLAAIPGFADVAFKTCSRPPDESATVDIDDSGAFHIILNLGRETFVSSTCKPLIQSPLLQIGIASIECVGDWPTGKGSVILDSADGVLNVLMYKGPDPLPSQYYDDRALFCGAPNRANRS